MYLQGLFEMSTHTTERQRTTMKPLRGTPRGHHFEAQASRKPPETPRDGQAGNLPTRSQKAAPRPPGIQDARHWETRIRRRTIRGGGQAEEWSLRLKEAGKDVWFGLHTSNRVEAAKLAKEIGLHAAVHGLASAEESFKRPKVSPSAITLGDWLCAASEASDASSRTVLGYGHALRRIVADVARVPCPDSRYDGRGGGAVAWRAQVDAVRLAVLTPHAVQRWQRHFCAPHANNPLALQRARRNANSFVRNARALFGKDVLARIGLEAPKPLPFEGVTLLPEGSHRYAARVDFMRLAEVAREELRVAEPEVWKALLLALCCGLRRGEIDLLTWPQVDAANAVVRIETTNFFKPKTHTSEREIPLSPGVLRELEAFRPSHGEGFVIVSPHEPPPPTGRREYRARDVFARLVAWLRAKGVSSDKPLHEARKEFGSLVTRQAGLFAASRLLGHSGVAITERHYAEWRERVTVDLPSGVTPPGSPLKALPAPPEGTETTISGGTQ